MISLRTFIILAALLASPALPNTADVPPRRINAPYFDSGVPWAEQAIFWFGQVNSESNYVDGRVGYNDEGLSLNLHIFDRRLWYDLSPSQSNLTSWDAATLYLDLAPDTASAPGATAHQFVAQVNQWEPPENYRAVYRGDGVGWTPADTGFTTTTGWRGNALNEEGDDRGWLVSFQIPFQSLGLTGPPPTGSVWRIALAVHDRDSESGTRPPDQVWPETMSPGLPRTWGELVFGTPVWNPPAATPGDVVIVRQGLNGIQVADGHVGGHTICGAGLDFWNEWGNTNYAGYDQINIQNQNDVADWPCFSKYYVTFPLTSLPENSTIISASLTMHQFGNAGGAEPQPSLIQVLTVAQEWSEQTLTWNNAPLAQENVASAWVTPLSKFPGWPGVAYTWDLSQAVAAAYAAGQPLRLALYSADTDYHSGKYFMGSDAGDWNAVARPTLKILWGDPVVASTPTPTPTLTATPSSTPNATVTPIPTTPPNQAGHHLYLPRMEGNQ